MIRPEERGYERIELSIRGIGDLEGESDEDKIEIAKWAMGS